MGMLGSALLILVSSGNAAIPGNQLGALERDRAGQHSIRVNDQFRICYEWKDGDAYAVEIADYH